MNLNTWYLEWKNICYFANGCFECERKQLWLEINYRLNRYIWDTPMCLNVFASLSRNSFLCSESYGRECPFGQSGQLSLLCPLLCPLQLLVHKKSIVARWAVVCGFPVCIFWLLPIDDTVKRGLSQLIPICTYDGIILIYLLDGQRYRMPVNKYRVGYPCFSRTSLHGEYPD